MLTAPAGIRVEGPPVRVPSRGEVSWRVVPQQPVSGKLEFTFSGAEKPRWIDVQSPPAAPWLAWFLAFSLPGALLPCLGGRR